MEKLRLFETENYKKATNAYKNLLSEIEQMKRSRRYNYEIHAMIQKKTSEIKDMLEQGKVNQLEEIDREILEMKRKYDIEREYVDPQLEMLRRQDFEVKLSNMEDNDIKDFVQEVVAGNYELNTYQLNKLVSKLRDTNLYDKNKLEVNLMVFAEKNAIGSEYKLTDRYQELENLRIELLQIPTYYLFTYSPVENEYILTDYQIEPSAMLNGYSINE